MKSKENTQRLSPLSAVRVQQVTGGSLEESKAALEIAETDGCCLYTSSSRLFILSSLCLIRWSQGFPLPMAKVFNSTWLWEHVALS